MTVGEVERWLSPALAYEPGAGESREGPLPAPLGDGASGMTPVETARQAVTEGSR